MDYHEQKHCGLARQNFKIVQKIRLPEVGGTPLVVAVVGVGVTVVRPGGVALLGDKAHVPVVKERSSRAMSPR